MIQQPDFFAVEEIKQFTKWVGVIYDKDNADHHSVAEKVFYPLLDKTEYWSSEVARRIPPFEEEGKRSWLDQSNRSMVFKPYTWRKIFKAGDKGKGIFFTVGVDGQEGGELIYKLDYQFSRTNLSDDQQKLIEDNIPPKLRWQSIPISKLKVYSWEDLINETASFIAESADVYDRLIQLVAGNDADNISINELHIKPRPKTGYSAIPEAKATFVGVDKDFVKESFVLKKLGDAGEQLVLDYEMHYLIEQGREDLAERVRKVLDGEGYDIHSYQPDGSDKFIEVKTTSHRDSSQPFYLTINEKQFAESHLDNYLIYRLYNYNQVTNTADFYIIENPLDECMADPIAFRMYIKNAEN
ncbi:MAG: DUF3883 domain-containing protein [Cyclobacteriaceae bacterium]